MSIEDEARKQLILSNENLIKKKQQQQEINHKIPPTPPPLPNFNIYTKSNLKLMNSNDLPLQSQLVKSRYKLTATALCPDEDFFSIYNQKPKIIKYVPLQGATNSNQSSNGSSSSSNSGNSKRLVAIKNEEVIQNNAKNSYYLNDAILYNIDNISPKEKQLEKMIVSKQGTIRGSLNHVKLSLMQVFKENEKYIQSSYLTVCKTLITLCCLILLFFFFLFFKEKL